MFFGCNSITDISPLKNWNVSKGEDFEGILGNCYSIIDRTQIISWRFSEYWGHGFDLIFN